MANGHLGSVVQGWSLQMTRSAMCTCKDKPGNPARDGKC